MHQATSCVVGVYDNYKSKQTYIVGGEFYKFRSQITIQYPVCGMLLVLSHDC